MAFGKIFSSQVKSIIRDASFWLITNVDMGAVRWMIVGK